jgi:Delta3-Delta2-enoyl-CoA isomerase
MPRNSDSDSGPSPSPTPPAAGPTDLVSRIDHDRVRELQLARPPVNALDPALIAALRAALKAASDDGCAAVVLSGSPGFFSAGLDVPALLRLDRERLRGVWQDFFALLQDLASYPVPVGAALTGHSPAGGAVLSLFADRRVAAEGPYRMGLNEVQVGLVVPPVLLRALTFLCGEREATRLAVGGLLVDPAEALRCGLVDEVCPLPEVIPRTVAWAADLTKRPATAMRLTRQQARRPLVEAFAAVDGNLIENILDQWYGAETQAVLAALVSRLGKPRA